MYSVSRRGRKEGDSDAPRRQPVLIPGVGPGLQAWLHREYWRRAIVASGGDTTDLTRQGPWQGRAKRSLLSERRRQDRGSFIIYPPPPRDLQEEAVGEAVGYSIYYTAPREERLLPRFQP